MLPGGVRSDVFREQKVLGAGWRPNNVCPRCGANDRERLMLFFLRDVLRLGEARPAMLHVAPERQLQRAILKLAPARYTTMDLCESGVMLHADLTRLPYRDEEFDALICNNVLEHVPDDQAAMRELARVLKPGGWVIIQAPVSLSLAATDEDPAVKTDAERIRRFGQRDHVRMYGRDFFDRLRDAGFDARLYRFAGDGRRFALPHDVSVHYCRKRPSAAPLPSGDGWEIHGPLQFR